MTPAAREAAVARLHRRARTVINGFSTDLPRYERAPTSMVEPEVVAGVHLNVDLFVRTLVTGVQPTEAEMAPIVAIAVQRHADGVAVGEIVATYQAGADLIWTAIIADADPQETAILLESASSLMRYLMAVTSRIADACGDRHGSTNDRDLTRQAVAQALIDGREPAETDLRQVQLTDRYRVAFVRARPTETTDLRAIAYHLRDDSSGDVLVAGHAEGLVALFPAHDDTGPVVVCDALRRSGAPPGVGARPNRFVGGVSDPVSRRSVPTALRQARLLADLTTLFGDGDGPAHVGDVLFPYLIATQTALHARLLDVVDDLSAAPVLAETVAVYLDCAGNQLAAARTLNVHRNTVGYRLMKAAELSGHDPTSPHGGRVHASARIVAALRDAGRLPDWARSDD